MQKKLLIESWGLCIKRPTELKEEEGGGGTTKWSAPVWRLDVENLNGRIYTRALAQKICDQNPVTVAYDGHDAAYCTGEEYGITKAVCSNPRIEGNELWVDIDFVDEQYEALVTRLADRGVPIGVSSVGWGDIDPATGAVKTESYELIRFLDFVTTPAGEVYARMKNEEGRKRQKGRSHEAVAEREADVAMATRRSKVAKDFADIFSTRRQK